MNENWVILEFLTSNNSLNWDGILSPPTLSHFSFFLSFFFPLRAPYKLLEQCSLCEEEGKGQRYLPLAECSA